MNGTPPNPPRPVPRLDPDRLVAFREYLSLGAADDDELEAVRLALLIEDLFGMVMPDAWIDRDLLSDPVRWTGLLAAGRGGTGTDLGTVVVPGSGTPTGSGSGPGPVQEGRR